MPLFLCLPNLYDSLVVDAPVQLGEHQLHLLSLEPLTEN